MPSDGSDFVGECEHGFARVASGGIGGPGLAPCGGGGCGGAVYRATINLRFSDKQDETLDGAGLRLRSGYALAEPEADRTRSIPVICQELGGIPVSTLYHYLYADGTFKDPGRKLLEV